MRKFFSNKKGQGLVEYGLIIAGVALVCAAAISLFGHKTADLVAATAAILPGSHADDNGAIVTGKLIETSLTGTGATAKINLGTGAIIAAGGAERLGPNLGIAATGVDGSGFGGLILEAE
ncbi:class III signal peptide-containing protein [bacterium]|nr:class III signal peptide-containing protein [Rubripirellula sp.]MDA7864864.1 class III signal peptide-containing protein [bacterium]MDA7874191.1 class III signal peptide-containing protein [Rhodopirellula sp.]MDB4645302.1 class III signal peptide-containing protein [Rubripirellula sp.]